MGNLESASPLDADKRPNDPVPINGSETNNYDITGSTVTKKSNDRLEVVTTESAGSPNKAVDVSTDPSRTSAAVKPKTDTVITGNTKPIEDLTMKPPVVEHTGHPKASLPGIGVFLDKTCTIPLVRCDFDTIKTAVESRDEGSEIKDNQNPNNPQLRADSGSPALRTSARKCMVIDYKNS